MTTKEQKQIDADQIRTIANTTHIRPLGGEWSGVYFRADALAAKAVVKLGYRVYDLPHGLRVAVKT